MKLTIEINKGNRQPTELRQCDDCSLCCKIPPIKCDEFQKPHNQWCEFVILGQGCGRYETRPQCCHDFKCMWLQGVLPDEYHPKKIHAVAYERVEGGIVIQFDRSFPGARYDPLVQKLINTFSSQMSVILIEGDQRTIVVSGGSR